MNFTNKVLANDISVNTAIYNSISTVLPLTKLRHNVDMKTYAELYFTKLFNHLSVNLKLMFQFMLISLLAKLVS